MAQNLAIALSRDIWGYLLLTSGAAWAQTPHSLTVSPSLCLHCVSLTVSPTVFLTVSSPFAALQQVVRQRCHRMAAAARDSSDVAEAELPAGCRLDPMVFVYELPPQFNVHFVPDPDKGWQRRMQNGAVASHPSLWPGDGYVVRGQHPSPVQRRELNLFYAGLLWYSVGN